MKARSWPELVTAQLSATQTIPAIQSMTAFRPSEPFPAPPMPVRSPPVCAIRCWYQAVRVYPLENRFPEKTGDYGQKRQKAVFGSRYAREAEVWTAIHEFCNAVIVRGG
jgi:hypothetical protein